MRAWRSITADLGYACRQVPRRPLGTSVMLAVLSVGLGLNVALFALIDAFVNGPLPGVARDDTLVRIRGIARFSGRQVGREFSDTEVRDVSAERTHFASVGAWTSADVVLDVPGASDRLPSGAATFVTPAYFPVLGVRPALGGLLPPGDAGGAPPAAVISDVVWSRLFGRAADVVGRSLDVNGVRVTVAGVAPHRFNGARTGGSTMRVWLPIGLRSDVLRGAPIAGDADADVFGLVARLAPGTTVEAAGAAARSIAERRASPRAWKSADVVPALAHNYFPPSGEDDGGGAGLFAALAMPILVLAITCTNVGALQAGIALARRREIAVRLSLGASRGRIVRQLLTESVALALAAAAVGGAIIWALWRVFESRLPDVQLVLAWPVVSYTGALAVAVGIVFGLSPALHATRVALAGVLNETAGAVVARRSRLQSSLVVAQIALTQPALLGIATLLLDIRTDVARMPDTAVAGHVVELLFNTNPRYGRIDQAREDAIERLRRRLLGTPGVVAAVAQARSGGLFLDAPADGSGGVDVTSTIRVAAQSAPPGYLDVMGLRLVQGRDVDATSAAESHVLVNAALARRLWGDANPVGRSMSGELSPDAPTGTRTVVGVVDERAARTDAAVPRLYFPSVALTTHLLVRTAGPAASQIALLRAVALDEAPSVPLTASRTLESSEAGERRPRVAALRVAGGAALVALFIAAVGLYAVVAFAVGQRAREIGIRAALGADRRRVVGLFVSRGLRLSAVGLGIGLALSLLVANLAAAAQGNEPPAELPALAVAVAGVVTTVALVATWLPARRAARIDPLRVLKAD
jgi:predicted permease